MRARLQTLKAGALYFALVFASGFALGTFRVVVMVPQFGARTAELFEAPGMLLVTFLAARWIVEALEMPPAWTRRLGMGAVALGLLLAAEFTLVLGIRGLTLQEYFASLDPVSGAVYYVLLVVYAVMPLLLSLGAWRR